jgi:Zn ribbon nucleic-acid-binding protein
MPVHPWRLGNWQFPQPRLFVRRANRCTIGAEGTLTSGRTDDDTKDNAAAQAREHRVLLGDQACPRCQKYFTVSYWSRETLVQARCLSCDLKWPRPDMV